MLRAQTRICALFLFAGDTGDVHSSRQKRCGGIRRGGLPKVSIGGAVVDRCRRLERAVAKIHAYGNCVNPSPSPRLLHTPVRHLSLETFTDAWNL